MNKLGRIANRIRRYGMLTVKKQRTRRLVRNYRAKAQTVENRIPKRKLLVKIETYRKTDRGFRITTRIYRAVDNPVILKCI